jgi:hypothetical protein
LAPLGGVVFVVLFVIGTLFLFSGAPSGDDPPAIILGILSLASVIFFPQFLWLLWVLVVSVVMFLKPARYGGAVAV